MNALTEKRGWKGKIPRHIFSSEEKNSFIKQTDTKKMNAATLTAKPEPKYLSSTGLISYLREYAGFAPSRSSLYKMTMTGQIPFLKGPGNRLLFPIADIRRWVESGGAVVHSETEHSEVLG